MKKQLQKMFYVFIIMMMFSIVTANAQIVYTNIIPDTTVSTNNGVYHLDLNNDGISDFNITYTTTFISQTCGGTPRTGTNIYIRITPLGANEVGNDTTYPSALALNSNIDSSSFKWKNNANQILTYKYWHCVRFGMSYIWIASYSGHWNGAVDKYIPLRLDVSSQKYYGWVRLDVATGAVSFTVKDYAYNSIPDSAILAGQTMTITGIIKNTFASSINLFPNPATNHLTINLPNAKEKVKVRPGESVLWRITIADISGKIIYSTAANETQKIEVSTKDFAEGIYVVQIQSADFIATKKCIIAK